MVSEQDDQINFKVIRCLYLLVNSSSSSISASLANSSGVFFLRINGLAGSSCTGSGSSSFFLMLYYKKKKKIKGMTTINMILCCFFKKKLYALFCAIKTRKQKRKQPPTLRYPMFDR